MKLQEFLCFRKICFVCGTPLIFRVTDKSDLINPKPMKMFIITHTGLLKFSRQSLDIILNPKKDNYVVYPNNSLNIKLEVEGYCQNNNHYKYSSQLVSLDYTEKTWGLLPDFQAEETIIFDSGKISTVINSYQDDFTTLIFSDGDNNVTVPLLNTKNDSYDHLNNELQKYYT